MNRLDLHQVPLQPLDHTRRQHGHSILLPFAVPDNNLPVPEINVLHSESNALHKAQACSIQQISYDPLNVSFFRSYAVVSQSNRRSNLVEKPRLFLFRMVG
jgi:hypothetical protein